MSVTLNKVEWARLGAVSSGLTTDFNSLRVISPENLITFSTNEIYKKCSFSKQPFNSTLEPEVNLPDGPRATFAKCLPLDIAGAYSYATHIGIFIYVQGQLYTFTQSTNNDQVYGFDATNDRYLAYSAHAQGLTSQGDPYNYKYLRWGQLQGFSPYTQFISSKTYNNSNIDFAGDCSLSRNGSYCVVFGSFNSQKTITVFQGVSGSGAVRVGANITLPDSTLYSVKINNSGTRVVAMGLNTIRTYDLISGAWTQVGSTINFSQPQQISEISLSADGTILIHRNSFYVDTFSWGAKWEKLNRIEILPPDGFTAYAGNVVHISQNAEYLAFDIWPTPSTKAVEIYAGQTSEITYDAPVITPGQSFTLAENTIFSGTPAMLVDELNRQVTAWSATGLPAGLSINASTGEVTGTATVKGQFSATITATNPDGSSTEAVQFLVQSAIPIFAGAIRATAVYAGTTAAQALYYGPQLLWNVQGWEPLPSSALFTGSAAGDEFGRSVAINVKGDRVIVGSPEHNRFGSNVGLVSFFEFSSGKWNRIDFQNTTNQSRFGISVAMNSTGDIVAVAGYTAAAVFTRNGSGFTLLGSNISLSNPAFNQGANAKVSLSGAGDIFAVSQMGADYSGTTRIFAWDGTAWVQRGATIGSEVSGDRSGSSISLSSSGTRIAIGAILSSAAGASSGHARVFEWSGSTWTQVGTSIPGALAGDQSGTAVSLNASGNRIAIGSPRHDTPARDAGHVRVFEEVDGSWVQMGQPINGEAIDNYSGGSVSLNASGDLVAIGAERNTNDTGHVRIYRWTGLAWEQQGADIDGDAAGDRFGFDVALNSSGTILIAGAPLNDASGSNAGAAKVLSIS